MAGIEPQSDREILLQLNGEIQNMKTGFAESIDRLSERLSDAIETFGENVKVIEEKKIGTLQKEIDDLKAWKQEMNGGGKLLKILGAIAAFILGALANKYMK